MAVATLLPNGKQQFIDQNGVPLVGGFVYFYIPSTTTPKTTWVDPTQSTPNTNPVVLDSRGQAIIYGEGQYRQQVYDVNNNLIWDQLVASTDYGLLQAANNLSDVANAATALANLGGVSSANLAALIPPGSVMAYAVNSAPTGWLICSGAAVSRSTYNNLFTAIGTTYGPGDGSSTFNLPNLGGYFIRGYDSSGTVDPNTIVLIGTTTNGSFTLTGITTTGISIGQVITDAASAIPTGTTVVSFTGTTVTMSAEATADEVSENITFTGRPFGSTQVDAFQTHGHAYTDPMHTHNFQNGNGGSSGTGNFWVGSSLAGSVETVQNNSIGITINGPNSGSSNSETRPKNVAMSYIIKT